MRSAAETVHMPAVGEKCLLRSSLQQERMRMDLQARHWCYAMTVPGTQQDCIAVGTDSDYTQHMPRDYSHQTVAAAEVAVVASSFEDCMLAAEATRRMSLQKSCFAATGTHPGTHIRSAPAALHRRPGCCTSPDPDTHTVAAAIPLAQLAAAVRTVRSVLAGRTGPDTRLAAAVAAGTARSDSTTCWI